MTEIALVIVAAVAVPGMVVVALRRRDSDIQKIREAAADLVAMWERGFQFGRQYPLGDKMPMSDGRFVPMDTRQPETVIPDGPGPDDAVELGRNGQVKA